MNKAPHLETISQTTRRIYDDLVNEHGKEDCERWFGGYAGLMAIIKEGGVQELFIWLNTPTPSVFSY